MTYTITIRETTANELVEMLDGTPEENATVDLLATAIAIDDALCKAMREAFPDATVELDWPMPAPWHLDHPQNGTEDYDHRAHEDMESVIYEVLNSAWESQDYWRFLPDTQDTGSPRPQDGPA